MPIREVPFMKSQNFEFLRAKRPILADLAGFAESYVYSDPASSLLKQRGFVENVVAAIYEKYRLALPASDNLIDMMGSDPFRRSVPEVVQDKLHLVRKAGNQAAHPRRAIGSELALECLDQLFDVARWFYLRIEGGDRKDTPTYARPAVRSENEEKAREALEKLRLAEVKYESVFAALQEETKKRLEAERVVEQNETALEELKEEGRKDASLLLFNEQKTRRRLIDQGLLEAGWNVAPNQKDTDEVRQEVKVSKMPSESGDGYADYVLYGDDGKPLAVVEAKRTAKDARVGAEQARIYAVCLEKETGVRPFIFYTNGIDIYLWDEAQGYPQRRVYGFYSKDSLEYLAHQRANKKPLATIEPNLEIADRIYQLEAVKRVCERFSNKNRKALLVQATGTGKTRVAISICDLLMRAGWAKRVLFLCDRRELRKQADLAFKRHMPGEPRVVVNRATSEDRNKRIYLATYPAMMQCYEEFDVGFFDLIIADESHRSIYKKFSILFRYFDALEVGLTATPVKLIERNTYELFDCRDQEPTAHFSFKDAVDANPPFLSRFRVRSFRSQFREKGIKYSQMSDEQKNQLESQDPNAEDVDYDPKDIDRIVFNKDTTRDIWRSLMEEGIREATGSHVGKTIVFARNHRHAVHMAEVFSETYPQYGSTFCRVIDNQEPKAEQLIDDFKDPNNALTIAISVDMLDTGIDVPEVVNLVFAKPVRSYVKFWQMIGRGTRLCPNLFGRGRHKTEFLIFDHWSNFWYFDEVYKETEPKRQKSLVQKIFEARIDALQAAIDKMDESVVDAVVKLISTDVRNAKNAGSIEVRERWKELELLSDEARIKDFQPVTKQDLLSIAAPLMQWCNIRGHEDAYRFDLLMTQLELALLRGGPTAPPVLDLKGRVEENVELLMKNQSPVKAKAATINQVRSKDFWATVTVPQLEEVRNELRGIMKYQQEIQKTRLLPQVLDVDDADFSGQVYIPKREGLDLVAYKLRVETVLRDHFAQNPTLQRIRAGKPVRDEDLEELSKLILQVDDKANVKHLAGREPETRRSLLAVFRGLVGLDPEAVERAFVAFVHKHPKLSAQQLRFLQVLQNYIAQNGGIEIERLYEPPFTTVHIESVDGVFPAPGEVDDLLAILATFEPKKANSSVPPPPEKVVG